MYTVLEYIHFFIHIHLFLFRKGITLSIIVDRWSLQERDWKSSMHSREETEWGSKLWIIIGDVAIPKISTRGNSPICWLWEEGDKKQQLNSHITETHEINTLCSYHSIDLIWLSCNKEKKTEVLMHSKRRKNTKGSYYRPETENKFNYILGFIFQVAA